MTNQTEKAKFFTALNRDGSVRVDPKNNEPIVGYLIEDRGERLMLKFGPTSGSAWKKDRVRESTEEEIEILKNNFQRAREWEKKRVEFQRSFLKIEGPTGMCDICGWDNEDCNC